MDVRIEADKVKLGMFVAKLDRPWLGTPFHFQGFWVNDLESIDNLRRFCREVWVRIDKRGKPTDVDDGAVDWKERTTRNDREAQKFDFLPRKPQQHADVSSVEDEMEAAQAARKRVCDALDEVVDDIQRGRKIAVVGLKDAVGGITDSVARSLDRWYRTTCWKANSPTRSTTNSSSSACSPSSICVPGPCPAPRERRPGLARHLRFRHPDREHLVQRAGPADARDHRGRAGRRSGRGDGVDRAVPSREHPALHR